MAEPLQRALEIIAQKKSRRSQPGMEAEGMRDIVMPMDSMSSQAYMDDQQGTAVLASPGRVRASFAVGSNAEPDRSPAAIMTAGIRRRGGGQTQQAAPRSPCADGQCGTGVTGGFATPYNFGATMGERTIAINGVPVDGAALAQATTSMPAAAPMAASAQQPAQSSEAPVQTTVQGRRTPEGILAEGNAYLDQADASWPANPAAAANNSFRGRARTQAALNMMERQPEVDLLERQQTQAELNAEVERKTQEFNLKAAKENTIFGFVDVTDAILAGEGEYAGKDIEVRADAAALYAQRLDSTGNPTEATRLPLEKWKNVYRGKAAAHDIGKLIAQNSAVTPEGRFVFRQGLKESIDQVVLNRFYGMKDGDTKNVLVGDALRNVMHQELDDILTRHIGGKILSASPKMNQEDAMLLARDEAFEIIDDYYKKANLGNLRYSGQQGGFWSIMQSLNPFGSSEQQPQQEAAPLKGKQGT